MKWSSIAPQHVGRIELNHYGILTGHWEFDLAILMVFFAVIAYSFLLPVNAPRGAGRVMIQTASLSFFIGALVLAVLGFRSL